MTNLAHEGDGSDFDEHGLPALDEHTGLPLVEIREPARGRHTGSAPRASQVVVRDGLPRFALSREDAAASLGMSLDSFERHVQPDLRLIRRGRMRLVPVVELERWAKDAAESTLR